MPQSKRFAIPGEPVIGLSRWAAQEIFEQEYAAPKELLHVAAGCYKYAAPLALWVVTPMAIHEHGRGATGWAATLRLGPYVTIGFWQGGAPEGNTGDCLGNFCSATLKPLKRLGDFCGSQSPG